MLLYCWKCDDEGRFPIHPFCGTVVVEGVHLMRCDKCIGLMEQGIHY